MYESLGFVWAEKNMISMSEKKPDRMGKNCPQNVKATLHRENISNIYIVFLLQGKISFIYFY
jgi:hypothetical protein